MNELTLFVNKFLKNHDIMYEGNQENDFNKLLQYFKAGINTYDHPDGFCKYDDNVLIIEHFEFDSLIIWHAVWEEVSDEMRIF